MINQIKLTGFGIHKDLDIQFKPGLNAIVGPNRHGKTHIMEAICFSLYGKTQNSTLDKIINFDMNKAVVNFKADDLSLIRSRTKQQSKLEGVDKVELEKKLNLNYQEFLSIFYISSHEQKSLFEPSYFRNFLISLFNLEIYSQVYSRLGAEYQGLQAAVQNCKKVNLDLLKQRYQKIQKIVTDLEIRKQKYDDVQNKCQAIVNQLAQRSGEIKSHWSQVLRKQNLLQQSKCTECSRPITPEFKHVMQTKIEKAKAKLQAAQADLNLKWNKVQQSQQEIQKQLNYYDNRIYKGRRILTIIQEKAKQGPQVNIERIKELEQIMPVFSPQGFPSYLLQVYLPVIITTANSLIQMIFPDMQVKIRTERPESNRPDFKVLIHKGDQVQEICDLCGAERVLINLCFRLGIMVIFKQLSQTSIDFMMCDEGMEKLDDSISIDVLKLFQNFIKLGYLKQVLLVTHKDILKKQQSINYIEL